MGLWPYWINQLMSKKFWSMVKYEGFLVTYQRGHKAIRVKQEQGGAIHNVPCVGRDEFGNRYYEDFNASHDNRKRWVQYADYLQTMGGQGDRIPPRWHGWLNYMYDDVPELGPQDAFTSPHYQKGHQYGDYYKVTRYNPKDAVFREEQTEFLKYRRERKAKQWEPTTQRQ